MEHDNETPPSGLWECIKLGYESLVSSVIRPERTNYLLSDLGPNICVLENRTFLREDIQLENYQGYKLQCSWWKPDTCYPNADSTTVIVERMPCIVSLHGNSSCRLGCMEIIQDVLLNGFTLFTLDFAGSGLSEGTYVSLGYHESHDIQTALEYLRATQKVTDIILWGRSMGAVACILCAERDLGIKVMILDSPFCNLSQLATELVDEGKLNVPKVAVKFVLFFVRRDVKKRAHFDILKLKPIDIIHKITVPCLFGVADDDELIPPHHGTNLYKKHKGKKRICHFRGGHNDRRPDTFYKQAIEFIKENTTRQSVSFSVSEIHVAS